MNMETLKMLAIISPIWALIGFVVCNKIDKYFRNLNPPKYDWGIGGFLSGMMPFILIGPLFIPFTIGIAIYWSICQRRVEKQMTEYMMQVVEETYAEHAGKTAEEVQQDIADKGAPIDKKTEAEVLAEINKEWNDGLPWMEKPPASEEEAIHMVNKHWAEERTGPNPCVAAGSDGKIHALGGDIESAIDKFQDMEKAKAMIPPLDDAELAFQKECNKPAE